MTFYYTYLYTNVKISLNSKMSRIFRDNETNRFSKSINYKRRNNEIYNKNNISLQNLKTWIPNRNMVKQFKNG